MANKYPEIEKMQQMAQSLRFSILDMVYRAGSGHIGGSFSICEILAVLYEHVLNVDLKQPKAPDRDRFVLSKGHAAPALYALFAEKGVLSRAELSTLRQVGSRLQGHPDMNKVPGIEISSGSLGMGISFGIGTQIAAKLQGHNYRTYVLTGCGELDEGQNWEGFLTAAKYRLKHLTVIVDYNKVQLDGCNDDILPLCCLADKIKSFHWHVLECDGHDIADLIRAFDAAKTHTDGPTAIIANTIKGKGVSFMESRHEWHGQAPDKKQYEQAKQELSGIFQ